MTASLKAFFSLGLTVLSITSAWAQNRVEVNQSGSALGNRAVISQSGSGNRVVVNQSGSTAGDSSRQPVNRGNLRVDSTAQTTINQQGPGPNRIELTQNGQTTTIINQSSETHFDSVTVLPGQENVPPRPRSTKRRNRR